MRVSGDRKGWKYAAEGAYQLGRVTSGAFGSDALDRRAFAAAAYVGRTFDTLLWTPTARIGGSYASGDDGGTTYKQFDPILPELHTWHGAMDVFAWSNLIEAHASVAVAPWADTSIGVEYRYARMAEANGDWVGGYLSSIGVAPGSHGEELGHEIDVGMRFRPWTPLELAAGYSLLALGDGAKAACSPRRTASRRTGSSSRRTSRTTRSAAHAERPRAPLGRRRTLGESRGGATGQDQYGSSTFLLPAANPRSS